eukprot:m.91761 g.91761  ORF g.91761 m.91761 type:complete len:137 (-) comp15050_c0_seq1:73-483(-)
MPGGRKRKTTGKREPKRAEFKTEAEYSKAWQRWRETRDSNNESVKRSRQAAKEKRLEHERLYQQRKQENTQLEALVTELKGEVTFLSKVLKNPESLDADERRRLQQLVQEANGNGALDAVGSNDDVGDDINDTDSA